MTENGVQENSMDKERISQLTAQLGEDCGNMGEESNGCDLYYNYIKINFRF